MEVSDVTKLASGPLIFTGGALRYAGDGATESRSITLNGLGGTFDVSIRHDAHLAPTAIRTACRSGRPRVMGNIGGLTKTGDGTLVLTGSNHFNGAARGWRHVAG